MSKTANWSYTNTALVKPFISKDEWGKSIYGEEFEIKCTWSAAKEEKRNNSQLGLEIVTKFEIFTEDDRPKKLDLIKIATSDVWEEVVNRIEFDMSFFNEAPDYKITV